MPEIFCRGDSGLSDLGEMFEVVKRNVEKDCEDNTVSLDLKGCAKVPQKRLLCSALGIDKEHKGEKTRIGMRYPVS